MTPALTTMQIAARAHRDADMLRSGFYGKMNGVFHGCSVGCFAYDIAPEEFRERGVWSNPHAVVADEYMDGQEWLARLQDTIFEGLPADDRVNWHVEISDAVASRRRDWQIVLHAVHVAILRISYRTAGSAQPAVQAVLDLHERAIRGEAVSGADWAAAAEKSASAAESASAAWSESTMSASAAWSTMSASAAWSAESAARAARSAMSASAAWSAESAAYQEIRDCVLAELARE